MPLTKLAHINLSNRIVKVLRSQILSGERKPGERIVESEIAKTLGISRGPLREALVVLKQEGLVVTQPGKGTYVMEFTEKDIEEIYSLRAVLESSTAVMASSNLGEKDLKKLYELLDAMCNAEGEARMVHHMNFHEEICRLADHKRLHTIWRSIYAQSRMLVSVSVESDLRINSNEMRVDHENLLRALAGGDKALIKEVFEKHPIEALSRFRDYMIKMREKKHQQEKQVEPLSHTESVKHSRYHLNTYSEA